MGDGIKSRVDQYWLRSFQVKQTESGYRPRLKVVDDSCGISASLPDFGNVGLGNPRMGDDPVRPKVRGAP
jgi:hypothetical protein